MEPELQIRVAFFVLDAVVANMVVLARLPLLKRIPAIAGLALTGGLDLRTTRPWL